MEVPNSSWEHIASSMLNAYFNENTVGQNKLELPLKGKRLQNSIGLALFARNFYADSKEKEFWKTALSQESCIFEGDYLKNINIIIKNMYQSCNLDRFSDNILVTILPIQVYSNGLLHCFPLFKFREDARSRFYFIDNIGVVHSSFQKWKANNDLPPGNMIFPSNGILEKNKKTNTVCHTVKETRRAKLSWMIFSLILSTLNVINQCIGTCAALLLNGAINTMGLLEVTLIFNVISLINTFVTLRNLLHYNTFFWTCKRVIDAIISVMSTFLISIYVGKILMDIIIPSSLIIVFTTLFSFTLPIWMVKRYFTRNNQGQTACNSRIGKLSPHLQKLFREIRQSYKDDNVVKFLYECWKDGYDPMRIATILIEIGECKNFKCQREPLNRQNFIYYAFGRDWTLEDLVRLNAINRFKLFTSKSFLRNPKIFCEYVKEELFTTDFTYQGETLHRNYNYYLFRIQMESFFETKRTGNIDTESSSDSSPSFWVLTVTTYNAIIQSISSEYSIKEKILSRIRIPLLKVVVVSSYQPDSGLDQQISALKTLSDQVGLRLFNKILPHQKELLEKLFLDLEFYKSYSVSQVLLEFAVEMMPKELYDMNCYCRFGMAVLDNEYAKIGKKNHVLSIFDKESAKLYNYLLAADIVFGDGELMYEEVSDIDYNSSAIALNKMKLKKLQDVFNKHRDIAISEKMCGSALKILPNLSEAEKNRRIKLLAQTDDCNGIKFTSEASAAYHLYKHYFDKPYLKDYVRNANSVIAHGNYMRNPQNLKDGVFEYLIQDQKAIVDVNGGGFVRLRTFFTVNEIR
ncbi:uncharacterized protein [Prorops nasuta]|uniref:uncharacterized protein n=1 Tax=Prorops nasuta TaxID=863751 RepID=UPI0034CDEDD4